MKVKIPGGKRNKSNSWILNWLIILLINCQLDGHVDSSKSIWTVQNMLNDCSTSFFERQLYLTQLKYLLSSKKHMRVETCFLALHLVIRWDALLNCSIWCSQVEEALYRHFVSQFITHWKRNLQQVFTKKVKSKVILWFLRIFCRFGITYNRLGDDSK